MSGPRKEKRKMMTLEGKMKIISRIEAGESASSIGRSFGINESSVRTIRAKKEAIKASLQQSRPLAAKTVKYARNPLLQRMESMLLTWIEDNNQKHIPVDGGIIKQKAMSILQHLVQAEEGVDEMLEFSASKGWFNRFRQRYNLHNIKFRGEAASADQSAADRFPAELLKVIETEGYSAKQVFNADETGLYWKRMPARTFISKEERKAPGFKVSKDRLTLLFCSNAEGDFKCKPLLIYKSANPRALKNLSKSSLPVHWRSNRRVWMTGQMFDDWFKKDFCPEVERYCRMQNITYKALLLVDNAPCHLPHIAHMDENVKVMFLPPNTTSLIQPLDQGVISTFKKLYLKQTFNSMFAAVDNPETGVTLRDFWKYFNIMDAVTNIQNAWTAIKEFTMNAAWRKVWPECVHTRGGFGMTAVECHQEVEDDVAALVAVGRSLGGEGFEDLQPDDIMELMNSHEAELSAEDLVDLEKMSTLPEEENKEDDSAPVDLLTIPKLQKALKMFEDGISFLQNLDSNYERGALMSRNVRHAVAPYNLILDEKRKEARQPTLMEFFGRSRLSTYSVGDPD